MEVFCLKKRLFTLKTYKWGEFKFFLRQCLLIFNFKALFKAHNCIKNSIFFSFFNYCRPTFALYKKHFYTLMKFLKLLVQSFNLLLLLLKPLQVKVNPFRINIQIHVHGTTEIYIHVISEGTLNSTPGPSWLLTACKENRVRWPGASGFCYRDSDFCY